MVDGLNKTVPQNLLFITNILNLVKVNMLAVPDLVEVTSSDVVLDCQYTVTDDNFTLQWIFNNSDTPVYEWKPYTEPKVAGILDGRLDLTYRVSSNVCEERRALRIVNVTPELTGNYTCVIANHDTIARKTKAMLIYSVEHDFELITERQSNSSIIELSCIARGVYPQPDLTIELNNVMVSGQHQRVWRNDGNLYDAICFARVASPFLDDKAVVACRLYLPQADYTAIKKKIMYTRATNSGECTSGWALTLSGLVIVVSITYATDSKI